MRVLVLADHEHELRVAHILASEPGVEGVAFLGSARSSFIERAESAAGYQVVVCHDGNGFDLAAAAGAAVVSAAEIDNSPVPAVVGASLLGVALAMAARLESQGAQVDRVATARPDAAGAGSERVSFPRPVGRVGGTALVGSPIRVVEARSEAPWAAVMVETDGTGQAVVDDFRFLEAIALAAGVALVPPAGVVRVWDSPRSYLARAEQMGLVAAARN